MPKKLTLEEFVVRAEKAHGKRFSYELVSYVNNSTRVKIVCRKHGVFTQSPGNHFLGKSCPKCSGKHQHSTEEFIEKARAIHGNKYGYGLANYKRANDKIKIICPVHGVFEQEATNHLIGRGCIKCKHDLDSMASRTSFSEFLKKALAVHGDKYGYKDPGQTARKGKIAITCKKHGTFYQEAGKHLSGRGCPLCNSSHGERLIGSFFKSIGIAAERQKKYEGCRNKRPMPFDFCVTGFGKDVVIEFNGSQHYQDLGFFGDFEGLKKRDEIKAKWCAENNARLLVIPYWETKNIPDLITDFIWKKPMSEWVAVWN